MGAEIAAAPGTPADLPALHALIESAYRGETARAGWTNEADLLEGPRTSVAELTAILNDAARQRLILFREGPAIVGCVHLTHSRPDTVYLGMLTVAPGRQAGGLGRHMLAVAETTGRDLFGATVAELSVVAQRSELIAYYERRGYRRTGETRPFPVPLDPPFFLTVLTKPIDREA